MSVPIIIIAGVPNLHKSLLKYSFFPTMYEAKSSTELKSLLVSPNLSGVKPSDIVFIFGDKIVEDDPQLPLIEFLRKLTQAGYQVVVISVTPKGAELQRQAPRSVLLSLPIRLNSILYSFTNFGINLEPLPYGNEDINISQDITPQWSSLPVADAPVNANAFTSPNPPVNQGVPSVASFQPINPVEQTTLPNTPPIANPYIEPAQNAFQNNQSFNPQNGQNYPPQNNTPGMPGSNWEPPQKRTLADYAQQPNQQPAQQTQQPFNPQAQPPYQAPIQSNPTTAPANPWSTVNPSAPVVNQPNPRFNQQPTYEKPKRRGFVTTISVSKGGTGKSSMTLNLAAFLGMRLRTQGKTVCVIDANTQQSDSGKYLDIYSPNINTIVNDPSLMTEERILAALIHKPEYNLSVLLGPPTPDEANPLAISARLYREILELLKKHYDYIFIDTPVAEKFHEMFSDFALPLADFIIVPVAPNYTTLHNADNWLRAAVTAPRHEGGAGIDRNKIGIVLNRAEDGIGCTEDDVRRTMANWHFIGVIPETKEWKASNNANELVAPKNFANLSHAFAEVLHASTGEPVLLENFATFDSPKKKKGFLDFLRSKN